MEKSGKINFALIKLLTRPVAILPLSFHRANGRFLGWLAGSVIRYRKDVVMTNLARSFPDKKYEELQEISKRFYRFFGTIVGEALWFGASSNPARLVKSGIMTLENTELANSFLDKGKSVIVISAHTGNWELSGGFKSYCNPPLHLPEHNFCVVYKQLSSRGWDLFMKWNRTRPVEDVKNYHGLVESNNILRYAYYNIHKGLMFTFITDQSPYGNSARVDVGEFMHQRTLSMIGAVSFAKHFELPVLYERCRIDENGNYHKRFELICEDASQCDAKDMMTKYYGYLQEDLEAQPWNYLWTHKRWK